MKTVLRKLVTDNKITIYKKLLVSVCFMIFFALLLYVLINSPA